MTKQLKDAIRRRHMKYGVGAIDGVLIFELSTGTGFSNGEPSRIDAFYMACRPSENLRRTAYEIKVSRGDFLREIRNPLKARPALSVSNMFYFVTPPGVAKVEEIPIDCGLLELDDDRLKMVVQAPYRDGLPANWMFLAAVARRLQREATK